MLTAENVESLQTYLLNAGLLEGLNAKQAHAICTDLFWAVERIVEEAIDRTVLELKVAAVMATEDCLDEQRAALFTAWQAQLACPH